MLCTGHQHEKYNSCVLRSCVVRCIAGRQTECGMVEKSVITQLRLHTSSHLVSNICPSPQCIVSVVPSQKGLVLVMLVVVVISLIHAESLETLLLILSLSYFFASFLHPFLK